VSPETTVLILGAAVGGFVQGVSGFAFAMVAMSIWAWGIDPRLAAVMAVFGGFTGQAFSALTIRRSLHLRLLLPFLIGAAVGVPLGVSALPFFDPRSFRLALGVILAVFSPAMLFAPRLPRITRGGRAADAAMGAVGGFMGAFGGFTGIAPTLWCTLRGYTKDEHRAVIQNFNLVALGATLTALALSGAVRREMLPSMAIVAPALVVPSLLGARVYVGLTAVAFRRLVLSLLWISGVTMIWAAL
jgi:uncharacterized protein